MARSNRIRIIGGRHRGRRLSFPAVPGLRPTPDRLRETLFNWLQPTLPGARCLDLFAGSGALGLEALSRGAGQVQLVERDARAARRLVAHLDTLQAGNSARVARADALRWLEQGPGMPFDVVFLDPPYALELLPESCRRLQAGGWLAPGALLYLEQEQHRPWPDLPRDWTLLRETRAGQAVGRLVQCATLCPPASE